MRFIISSIYFLLSLAKWNSKPRDKTHKFKKWASRHSKKEKNVLSDVTKDKRFNKDKADVFRVGELVVQ